MVRRCGARLRVPSGVRVELAQLLPQLAGGQLHPAKQRITNQHPEGPRVGCHRRGSLIYEAECRILRLRVSQFLPFVQQAGVDLADQFAEPRLQVTKRSVLASAGTVRRNAW